MRRIHPSIKEFIHTGVLSAYTACKVGTAVALAVYLGYAVFGSNQ